MSRFLQNPTPAVRALPTVVPSVSGGTNGGDEIAAATAMGVVSLYDVAVPNGVAQAGADGFIPSAQLPTTIITGATIDGPDEVFVNQTVQFTITNFDVATNYVVSVSAGSFDRYNETITFTAPATPQDVTLTVNSRTCIFKVESTAPVMPVITSPTQFAVDRNSSVSATSSTFAMSDGSYVAHQLSDWQVASDINFETIAVSSINDTVNKTSWTFSGLLANRGYYIRTRQRSVNGVYSKWSNPNYFRTKTVF